MSCAKTKKSQSFCVWSNVPPYFCAALCPKNQHQGRRIMWATASVAHIISFPDVVFPKKGFFVTRATHLAQGSRDANVFQPGQICLLAKTNMSSSQDEFRNTYLGPLVAEISHGGFRLLGRCCVVFCCWLSILKNTFIFAAQRKFFLKTEWLTPHAATEMVEYGGTCDFVSRQS